MENFKAMENTDKLAVLIDADNAQPSIVDSLLAEIANYGIASVKERMERGPVASFYSTNAAICVHKREKCN